MLSSLSWLAGIMLVGASIAVFALAASPRSHHAVWIDPVTGSVKRQITRASGVDGPADIQPSALHIWLERREGVVQPHWAFVSRTTKNYWGRSTGFACGRAPDIYSLAMAPEVMEAFVGFASEDDLVRFVQTMRTGTDHERQAAVHAAFQRALEAM